MAKDDRAILELLKDEGFHRARRLWTLGSHAVLPKSAFQDSLTCINYCDPDETRPCNECHLIDFVANEHHSEEVPCHFIALTDAGETIEDLEAQGNQAKLEATVKQWMRARIKQIEDQGAKSEASKPLTV